MRFALALLTGVLQSVPSAPAPDTAHLVVVATTDVHGRVLGWDDAADRASPGGLSRAATILQTLRAQYPHAVLLFDAGDLIQGNPFATYYATVARPRPNPLVDALNALQYDAATPGNHEFNFGLDVLGQDASDATYRYVSANITRGAGDTTVFAPYTIVTRQGVRVGVTGFTTPGVMVWDRAHVVGRVRVRRIADAAPRAMRLLERAGADLKIALVHSGLGDPSSYDTTGVGPENDARALAFVEPKPDLVIFGHTHREVRDTVINGVHFVQPKNWARSLSVVHVWLARATPAARWRVVRIRADLIPLDSVAEQPAFVRRLALAHEAVRTWAAEPLGVADAGFDGRYGRAEDTPLLQWIGDVERRRTGADLAAVSDFDVRAGLPAGEVHLRDIAAVYPYENTLVAVRISGRGLRDYLEHAARYYHTWLPGHTLVNERVPGYDFDVVTGVDYRIDLSQPPGSRIRGLTFRGRPVAPGDSFTLALNSYRAAGGGGFDAVRGAPIVYDRGDDIRTLLADDLRRVTHLAATPYAERHWAIEPAAAAAAARAAFAPPAPVVAPHDSTLVRILAVTDFHGALAPQAWPWSHGEPVGGIAAIKSWMDTLAARCACASVRLDGGDEMQGTPVSNLSWGRPVIAALNTLGLDAAAIGNHEFDWTVDTLRARMADARYQFVSANITDSAGTARPAWADPWTIVSRPGVRVAVIGLTTTTTPVTTEPRNVTGLAFGDLAAAVRRVLPEARRAADVVVVLAHEGAVCDSTACHGAIIDLARALDSGSVDLIVAGHTHRMVNTRVNGIPIVEASSSGRDIAVADVILGADGRRRVETALVPPYADSVTPDTAETRLVRAAAARVAAVTAQPVARLQFDLSRAGAEYALGRLIADAQRNIGRADVAIMNNGGIRADLSAGTVTWGDLYKVQPFGNHILRLTVSGATLLAALEHALDRNPPDAHLSGVQVWYDWLRPAGRRIRRTRLDNGRPIDPRGTYTLAVTDFLAAGGDGYAMLVGRPAVDVGETDLQALIAYLAVLPQPVVAPADPRLHVVEH